MLENGCGIGMYVEHLARLGGKVTGLEFDFERARQAAAAVAAGSSTPPASTCRSPAATFDLVLSHEVLEHVQDDRAAVAEMAAGPEGRWARGDLRPKPRLPVRDPRHLLARQVPFRQQAIRQLPAALNPEQAGAARSGLLRARPAEPCRRGCRCAWWSARSSLAPTTTSLPGSAPSVGSCGPFCRPWRGHPSRRWGYLTSGWWRRA